MMGTDKFSNHKSKESKLCLSGNQKLQKLMAKGIAIKRGLHDGKCITL